MNVWTEKIREMKAMMTTDENNALGWNFYAYELAKMAF